MIDQVFAVTIVDIFSEINDLQDGSPVHVEPFHAGIPNAVMVSGTLHDGRALVETYLEEDGSIWLVRGIGVRYRIVAGDYFEGTRKRRYAAFYSDRSRR